MRERVPLECSRALSAQRGQRSRSRSRFSPVQRWGVVARGWAFAFLFRSPVQRWDGATRVRNEEKTGLTYGPRAEASEHNLQAFTLTASRCSSSGVIGRNSRCHASRLLEIDRDQILSPFFPPG